MIYFIVIFFIYILFLIESQEFEREVLELRKKVEDERAKKEAVSIILLLKTSFQLYLLFLGRQQITTSCNKSNAKSSILFSIDRW